MYSQKEIGARITQLRIARGLTQEKVAEDLHICTAHFQRAETAKRNISLDLLVDIAEYFEVSLDYLVLGKTPSNGHLKEQLQSMMENLQDLYNSL